MATNGKVPWIEILAGASAGFFGARAITRRGARRATPRTRASSRERGVTGASRNPSADGWELYTSYDATSEQRRQNTQAAKELNAALAEAKKELRKLIRKAIKDRRIVRSSWGDLDPHAVTRRYTQKDLWGRTVERFDTNADVVSELIAEVHHSVMYPVHNKWADRGAADTEPRAVAFYHLREEAGKVFGLEPGEGHEAFWD